MEAGIIVIAFFIIFIGCAIVSANDQRKMRMRRIRDSYGKIPQEITYPRDKVGFYWEVRKKNIPKTEVVDDVTWNDLEMDKVYARLNSCVSYAGDQVLYARLHEQLPQEKLADYERRITEMQTAEKKREHIQEKLLGIGKEENSYYLPTFIGNVDSFSIPNIWMYRGLQILLLLALITAIVMHNVEWLVAFLMVYGLNACVYVAKKQQFSAYIDSLGGLIRVEKMVRALTKDDYTKDDVPVEVEESLKKFAVLEKMIGMFQNSQMATITGDVLAVLREYLVGATLIDFTNCDRILRMLRGRQEDFMRIYAYAGELDLVISVASFRESLPLYCRPVFGEDRQIKMQKIYHPLLGDPVCNDVTLDKNCIITGSNASGKSTFIKAVAVNAILAQSIHTCMAEQFILPPCRIITSMAIRDDMCEAESYYMKEIKYLKRIVDSLDEGKMVLCVIDEILRGTNTEERIAASTAVLRYVNRKNCLAIVASHDYELTQQLEKEYDFYYFCENMGDQDIIFDYKIRKGVGNTKNAIRLLEFVGFPRSIIQEARALTGKPAVF